MFIRKRAKEDKITRTGMCRGCAFEIRDSDTPGCSYTAIKGNYISCTTLDKNHRVLYFIFIRKEEKK